MDDEVDYTTLENFFAKVQLNMKEGQPRDAKSLQFSTEQWNWCFDAENHFNLHHWHSTQPAPIHCNTIITTSAATLFALASGTLKPMQAYLSGKMKFTGDRSVLKSYGKAMKEAMQSKAVDRTSSKPSTLSASITDSQVEKYGDREVVKYVIEVEHHAAGQSWKVRRRYSDFLKLQYSLHKSKTNIKAIKSVGSVFSSKDILAKQRIAVLNDFLQNLVMVVPADDAALNNFLMNDQRSVYLFRSSLREDSQVSGSPLQLAQEDIRSHLVEHSLPYDMNLLHSNVSLLNEMVQMKSTIKQLSDSLFKGNASIISTAVQLFQHLFALYIAYVICKYGQNVNSNEIVAREVEWQDVRRHFYALICLLQLCFSNSLFVTFLYISMGLSYSVSSQMTFTPNSDLIMTLMQQFMTNFTTLSQSLLDYCVSNLHHLLLLTTQINLSYISLCFLYTISVATVIMRFIMPRFIRVLEIYILGFNLILFYVFLSLLLKVMRYDEAQRTAVYNFIDQYIAVYVTEKIKHYRSIFIKFAQYFGARSDVMSSVWSEKLSVLQDQCTESRYKYVRNSVQNMLVEMFDAPKIKVDDIFEEFDMHPVASASIAQVHFALLNLNKLKEMKCKNAAIDWERQIKTLEKVCSKSLSHEEFSVNLKAGKGINNVQFLMPVAVKVQHEEIDRIMTADMAVVLNLTKLAAKLDSRWKSMVKVMKSWQKSMLDELDFTKEANNLQEMHDLVEASSLNCIVPQSVFPLASQKKKVFVMSRIYGYKVTDKLSLAQHNINRGALVTQIAHCCAYQMLQKGVFNADPHPGNIFFCLKNRHVVPGLLDFGMTVRLSKSTRILYCELVLALFEGDMQQASQKLQKLGYATNQSSRVPERDAEFFEYLMRDAAKGNMSKSEMTSYTSLREKQKQEDMAAKVREKGGRQITSLPEDFLYITRVIGLLRGLSADLACDCPILYILALHAKAGLYNEYRFKALLKYSDVLAVSTAKPS